MFDVRSTYSVGETDVIFVAHDANRGKMMRFLIKPLKMAAYKFMSPFSMALKISSNLFP